LRESSSLSALQHQHAVCSLEVSALQDPASWVEFAASLEVSALSNQGLGTQALECAASLEGSALSAQGISTQALEYAAGLKDPAPCLLLPPPGMH